jgi:hypothetical protein
MIGLRAYPRREHIRRYEQWMIMPLVSMVISVATGVATGLMVTGGWGLLWGFNVLSGSFFLTVSLGLWFGLIRRTSALEVWEADASLEAIHAEVTDACLREAHLPASLLHSMRMRLESWKEEIRTGESPKSVDLAESGLSWQAIPRAGVGLLRDSDGVRVPVPLRATVQFLVRCPWLLLPLMACLAATLLAIGESGNLFPPTITLLMLIGPALAALIAARAEVVYLARARVERAEIIHESLAAIASLGKSGAQRSRRSLLRRKRQVESFRRRRLR